MVTYPTISQQNADNIYSATLQEFSSEVRSQVFAKIPAVDSLWRNKGESRTGIRHEWRVRAGRNSNAKMVNSDADTVDFNQQQNVVTAFYTYMAFFAVPVVQSLLRDSIQTGPSAIIDLTQQDMKQATETLRFMLSTQTFGDGSNNTLIGLTAILPTSVGSNTVYGIAESSALFWKSFAATSEGSFAANGLHGSSDDKLTRAYLTCSDNGAQTPNLVISDRATFEYYVRALGQVKRITKDTDFDQIGRKAVSGVAGQGIAFYDAEWVWDAECPAGRAYMVHTDDFVLMEDPSFNFKWIGPIPLGRQFLLKGRVLTYRCQSKVWRRNWNGVTDGWTA